MSKRSLPGVQRTDAFLFDPEELVIIDDPKHPLCDLDPMRPVTEAFIRNLDHEGIIQPICVATGQPEGTVVVAGRRRTLGLCEANKRRVAKGLEPHRIPAMRRRGEPQELASAMLAENIHRVDYGPMELAKRAQKMLDFGRSNAEVEMTFGWTAAQRSQHLALLEVSAPVRAAVQAGKVSVTAAAKLGTLDPAQQSAALALLASGGEKPTVKNIKREVAAAEGRTIKSAPGKRTALKIAAALENGSAKERAFALGVLWAIGEMTSDEAKDAGVGLDGAE